MTENLLLADLKKAIKDTFGGVITSFDTKIPRYEAAEGKYEEAKTELRSQVKRIFAGLDKLDAADTPERIDKIKSRMVNIAQEDIAQALGATVDAFVEIVKEYIKSRNV